MTPRGKLIIAENGLAAARASIETLGRKADAAARAVRRLTGVDAGATPPIVSGRHPRLGSSYRSARRNAARQAHALQPTPKAPWRAVWPLFRLSRHASRADVPARGRAAIPRHRRGGFKS